MPVSVFVELFLRVIKIWAFHYTLGYLSDRDRKRYWWARFAGSHVDVAGKSIPLYRYNHEPSAITPTTDEEHEYVRIGHLSLLLVFVQCVGVVIRTSSRLKTFGSASLVSADLEMFWYGVTGVVILLLSTIYC